jgi:hypothetical protein
VTTSELPAPLHLVSDSQLTGAVQKWAHESMRPWILGCDPVPPGTLLIRTAGTWDSLVAVATHHRERLVPLLLLKNPVPLWHTVSAPPDGPVDEGLWPHLRRDILIHNPGLGGFLELLDRTVSEGSERF